MGINEVKDRTPLLIQQLLEIWEKSVRATHLFLSDNEIKDIKKYVPQAINAIAHLIVVENENKYPIAFMGIEEQTLEMLFIAPEERGNGLGKRLMSKTHVQKGFMNTWVFKSTKEQTTTNRGTPIRFYT